MLSPLSERGPVTNSEAQNALYLLLAQVAAAGSLGTVSWEQLLRSSQFPSLIADLGECQGGVAMPAGHSLLADHRVQHIRALLFALSLENHRGSLPRTF